MGVPAMFRWLKEKMPKCIEDCVEDSPSTVDGVEVPVHISSPNPNGIEFDNLYIDMNGVIHPCVHPEDVPAPETEEEMFAAIIAYVDRLVAAVRPRRLLYLAIDGVAPRAKMNQQRSRRFKAAQDMQEEEEVEAALRAALVARGQKVPPKKSKASFDHNVITPGTRFMDKLSTFLQYYITKRVNSTPGWRDIRVILSDASVPGEGEHKIMDFIRQQRASTGYNPNTVHCIHGLDADLIMLALATHEQRFSILREDVFGNKQGGQSQKCFVCGREGHRAEQCSGSLAPPPSWDESAKEASSGSSKKPSSAMDASPHSHASLIQRKPLQFLHIPILREYLDLEFKNALAPMLPPLPGFIGGDTSAPASASTAVVPSSGGSSLPTGYRLERVIDDFVFLCFFVGNDFLPHLPSLDIREGAIDLLLALYKQVLPSLDGYLTENGTIHLGRVDVLLQRLGVCETEIFRRRRVKEEKDARMDEQRKREQEGRQARSNQQQAAARAREAGAAVALNHLGDGSEPASSPSSSSVSVGKEGGGKGKQSAATKKYRAATQAAELALKEGMAMMKAAEKESKSRMREKAAAQALGSAAAAAAVPVSLRHTSSGSKRGRDEGQPAEGASSGPDASAGAAEEPLAKRSRMDLEEDNKSAAAALKSSLLGRQQAAPAPSAASSDSAEIALDDADADADAGAEAEAGLFMPAYNPSSKEGVTGDAAKSHAPISRQVQVQVQVEGVGGAAVVTGLDTPQDAGEDDSSSIVASTVLSSAAGTIAATTATVGALSLGQQEDVVTGADEDGDEDSAALALEAEALEEGVVEREVSSAITGILKVSVLKALMEKRTHENVADPVKLGVGHASEWRERYYKSKFGEAEGADPVFMSRVYKSYIEGLVWVFKYYYQGVVSWTWFYPYHYAPFAGDLRQLGAMQETIRFDLGKPFRPLDQLMGVLPPRSSHALPAACKALMCEESSPVKDFYPERFEMDPNGKKFTWQWVVVLPFIEEQRLIKAIDSVAHTFTDEERRRNLLGSDLLFVNQGYSGLAKYLLPLFKLDLPPQVSSAGPGAAANANANASVPVVTLKPHLGDASAKGLSASCLRVMDAPAGYNRRLTVPNPTKAASADGGAAGISSSHDEATFPSPFRLTLPDLVGVQVLIVALTMPVPRKQHICGLLPGAEPAGSVLDPMEDDPSGRIPRLTRGMNITDLAYAMTAETHHYSQGAALQRAMANTHVGQAMMGPQQQYGYQQPRQAGYGYGYGHPQSGFPQQGPGFGMPQGPAAGYGHGAGYGQPQGYARPPPQQYHHHHQQPQQQFFGGGGGAPPAMGMGMGMGMVSASAAGAGMAAVGAAGYGGFVPAAPQQGHYAPSPAMPMPMPMPAPGGMMMGMGMPGAPGFSFGAAPPPQQHQQAPRPFSFRR